MVILELQEIWIDQTNENFINLKRIFLEFGLPIMDKNLFLSKEVNVFTYGRPPLAINIMTECKGLDFEISFQNAKIINVDQLNIRLISYNDLIHAKKICWEI